MNDRKRVSIKLDQKTPEQEKTDFTKFGPRKPQAQPTTSQISEAAQQTGFTTRHAAPPPPKIDGRSLRATKRTAQFNIAVAPHTKDRFWALAKVAGAESGEEFLIRLMDGFVGG